MTLPILTDSPLQSAAEVLGPSGTFVSAVTAMLLTYRFIAFMVRSAMWFYYRQDRRAAGLPSLPPPELPPSLGLVLLFALGSALALAEPAARLAIAHSNLPPIVVSGLHQEQRSLVAANAEAPQKKPAPKEPKKGCGPGCTGTYPNCRCTGKTETQTKISGVPTSILGDDCQPWSIEPLHTGPRRPSS